MGVLVAVSIPIFTAQLEKAREATNQANARAGYAAAVAKELEAGAAHSADYSYEYDVAKASVGTAGTESASCTKAIAEWGVDDALDGTVITGDNSNKNCDCI